MHLVSGDGISPVPRNVALCLYRVAQEALSNVVRHSGAHRVELSLTRQGEELVLEVSDDGRGFTTASDSSGGGLGLRSAAERVYSVGGMLKVESTPGAGTSLHVSVPLKEPADA